MIEPESNITYTTFTDFCSRVRGVAFPDGIGENLVRSHDTWIKNALIKAQRYIACMRKIQVSFYYKDDAYDHCGVSLIQGPRGKINAVYAFKPNDPTAADGSGDEDALCRKYFYKNTTPQHITNWSRTCDSKWKNPSTVDWKTGSEVCYPYYESGTEEDDCEFKYAEKFFARGQTGQIYLAPRFPCGYIIAVHWEGIRRKWNAADAVPDDEDLIDWAASYMQVEQCLRNDHDASGLHDRLVLSEQTKFADLMYWCNEERMMSAKLDATSGIDTGNLNEMFQSIYPLPTTDEANP